MKIKYRNSDTTIIELDVAEDIAVTLETSYREEDNLARKWRYHHYSLDAVEYYENTYNYVGIVHFAGMALAGKVITGISLRVVAAMAGYGAGSTKTVFVRASKYQAVSQSGITGGNYYGDALGTFTGSFYNNTTTYSLSGALLDNLAAYFAAGNNTICLFNPSPVKGSQGYSTNYLQWEECTITVTYEEAASQPTLSAYTVNMGSSVTIYTNRQSASATHTLRYSFFSASGVIANGVTLSTSWTPPVSLASQIPNAASGWGTIFCDTYVNGTLVSTKSCTLTLNVPSTIVPSITGLTYAEATAGIAAQFGGYVRTRSKLKVSITASGAQGSTISSYRATLGGAVYTTSSFTTGTLNTAGSNTLTVSVTDSRGRVATTTRTISVLDYSPPSLTKFTTERCNSAGTAPQMDGTRVRVSISGSVSPTGTKNTISCVVYYKTSAASAWVQAMVIAPSSYSVNTTNLLLTQTFDALSSYDLKVRLQDYFYAVEQTVSVGTKQVMMDFYKDGSGVAFGKVAETPGAVEFGWPVKLSAPLAVDQGGVGCNHGSYGLCKTGRSEKERRHHDGQPEHFRLSVSVCLPAADVQRHHQPHRIRGQLCGRFLVCLVARFDWQ